MKGAIAMILVAIMSSVALAGIPMETFKKILANTHYVSLSEALTNSVPAPREIPRFKSMDPEVRSLLFSALMCRIENLHDELRSKGNISLIDIHRISVLSSNRAKIEHLMNVQHWEVLECSYDAVNALVILMSEKNETAK